jgi:hypothetical protein
MIQRVDGAVVQKSETAHHDGAAGGVIRGLSPISCAVAVAACARPPVSVPGDTARRAGVYSVSGTGTNCFYN